MSTDATPHDDVDDGDDAAAAANDRDPRAANARRAPARDNAVPVADLEHFDITVTPGHLHCGGRGCPAGDIHSLTVQRRAGNAWRGQVLVVFGLVVMPLILYMPCITGVTLLSVIIGGSLWLAAEPAGYALVLRTRRGTTVQLARHEHAHTIYGLHAHLLKTLGLPTRA